MPSASNLKPPFCRRDPRLLLIVPLGAELVDANEPAALLMVISFRLNAAALGVSGVATFTEGQKIS